MATQDIAGNAGERSRPLTAEERKVIIASSAGTIFEWYDFYLYGALAGVIGAQFFTAFDETTRNIFALLAFAAGFLVRPFGALFFGRLGDLTGRKFTFMLTILIMGSSTALVGVLPTYGQIGLVAPVILVVLRLAQGLAQGRILHHQELPGLQAIGGGREHQHLLEGLPELGRDGAPSIKALGGVAPALGAEQRLGTDHGRGATPSL